MTETNRKHPNQEMPVSDIPGDTDPKMASDATETPPASPDSSPHSSGGTPAGDDGRNTPQKPEKHHRKRTIFYICAVIVALLLFTVAVMDKLIVFLRSILSIIAPLTIGAVIAYLCNPILDFFEYRVFRKMPKGGLRRGLSLFLTILTLFGLFALVLVMIIPELINSLTELFTNYESYLNSLLAFLQNIINRITANSSIEIDISNLEKLTELIEDMFGSAENAFSQMLAKLQEFLSEGDFLGNAWKGLLSLFNAFKNLFIGLFIAFYILGSKEKRSAQIRKFRRAMFSRKTDERITEITTLADRTFSGFIYGKILDSLVIGILTFILLSIFEVSPYNMLIATFVGITNIIPVFGPFIGAIPSFFIVLISNPSCAILFLILIFIIQQIDGNIIGPKILGDNTGISSLGVLVAIVICSSLWGIVGMIVGVPIFAVIIELVKRLLEKKLAAQNDPTDTLEYYPKNAVSISEKDTESRSSRLRNRYEHSRLKVGVTRMKTAVRRKFHLSDPDSPSDPDNPSDPSDPSGDHDTDHPNTDDPSV